jgi:hypothetical protein
MKPRHAVLGLTLLVAAGFAFFGDKTPNPPKAAPRSAAPQRAPAPPVAGKEPAIVRLIPRAQLIAGDADPIGQGEDVFLSQDWTPPPPKPGPAPPPPPPAAPPLPFTYLGKSVGQGSWEVYLARGDQTFIVHVDSVIDGVYRVDAIAPPTMKLTYLPLKQVQQINIGVLD